MLHLCKMNAKNSVFKIVFKLLKTFNSIITGVWINIKKYTYKIWKDESHRITKLGQFWIGYGNNFLFKLIKIYISTYIILY